MSADITGAYDDEDEDHARFTLMRIVLTILFGGLLMLLLGAVATNRPITQLPRRRRPLLTVEEAVRWRPDY